MTRFDETSSHFVTWHGKDFLHHENLYFKAIGLQEENDTEEFRRIENSSIKESISIGGV